MDMSFYATVSQDKCQQKLSKPQGVRNDDFDLFECGYATAIMYVKLRSSVGTPSTIWMTMSVASRFPSQCWLRTDTMALDHSRRFSTDHP